MKKLWLHSVRVYLKLGLFFYFRRIHIHHIKNIPKDKPVLLLANHHNALLDALLIATNGARFYYFLTRAGVFKSQLVTKILKSLQMLPVYRIRDGWNNLPQNNQIFSHCANLLSNNEAVVIFPEGSHNLMRTVRPLSKGFTRIVFETLETHPELDLQLIPVGLNYLQAAKFPDSVAIYFGNPFDIKQFNLENKHEAVIKLKEHVQIELSKLTTHIPVQNYDETLKKLENLQVDFLNPQSVNTNISNNFKETRSINFKKASRVSKIFKPLLIVLLIVPYLIWKFLIEPKVDEIEFVSTFRFTVAITLVPFWVLIMFFWLGFPFGIAYVFFVLITSLLVVKA